MTIKMTSEARKAAYDLAIAYSAWMQTDLETSPNSVAVWGGILLEAQELTGIEISSPSNINALIVHARAIKAK